MAAALELFAFGAATDTALEARVRIGAYEDEGGVVASEATGFGQAASQ